MTTRTAVDTTAEDASTSGNSPVHNPQTPDENLLAGNGPTMGDVPATDDTSPKNYTTVMELSGAPDDAFVAGDVSSATKTAKGGMIKKALVAGINNYPDPRNFLPSCIADADAFAQLLKLKYSFTEIRRIVDDQVTIQNFQDQLDWLVSGATSESRLVLYYSGHGYTTETSAGVKEEFLCLFDGFLKDDALVQRTRNLPPGVLTVVLDSCFSGGMEKQLVELTFRDAIVNRIKSFADDDASSMLSTAQLKATFTDQLPEPEVAVIKVFKPDAGERSKDLATDVSARVLKPFGRAVVPLPIVGLPVLPLQPLVLKGDSSGGEEGQVQLNGLLLTASLETETASASTSRTRGLSAFTHSLINAVNTLGTAASTRQMVNQTITELRSLGFKQTPQIKEPPTPGNLTDQAFINLSNAGGGVSVPGTTAGQDLESIVRRVLAGIGVTGKNLSSATKGDAEMLPSTTSYTGDKDFWDDIARIAAQVVPVVLQVVTQQKVVQGGGTSMSSVTTADKAFWDDIARIAAQVVPVVLQVVTQQKVVQGGGGITTKSGSSGLVNNGDNEKFLSILIPAIASIVPSIIQAVTKSVDGAPMYGSGSSGSVSTGDNEKFLNILIPAIASIVPSIIQAVTKSVDGAPMYGSGSSGSVSTGDNEKFLNILIPAIASIVPSIIQAVTKSVDGAPMYGSGSSGSVSTGDNEKFLSILIPAIASIVPSIIQAVTKTTAGASTGSTVSSPAFSTY